jgi:hypothetical protein
MIVAIAALVVVCVLGYALVIMALSEGEHPYDYEEPPPRR